MGWKQSKPQSEPVMEETVINTSFDMTDEKYKRLVEVTRTLKSVLDVNVKRRQIVIKFENFYGQAERRSDLREIEKTLLKIAIM